MQANKKKQTADKDQSNKPTPTSLKRGVSYLTFGLGLLIVLIIGLALGQRSQQLLGSFFYHDSRQLSTSQLQQTYNELAKKFDGKLNKQKLMQGASRGLVAAAGDPYTVYLNKKEAQQLTSDLDGTFTGIGAELGEQHNKLVVIAPLDDSPAKKAGLKAGDVIAKVNDEDTSNWSIDTAVSKIKGQSGTTVKLTIVRGKQVIDISITREAINNPSVKTEKRGDIGIIRISRFGNDTASLARKAAQQFHDQHVKGVVVDVRGNGGGYLSAAQDVASLWLKPGQVVVTERAGGKVTETHKADGDDIFNGLPTVVLIDGGSASASEILASALKDNGAAQLLGQKSYGKGSVQQIIDLTGGAKLKVTVAHWYTPGGKSISKKGISPDIAVKSAKDDNGRDKDAQLDEALKILE